jgi:hypothetical protein
MQGIMIEWVGEWKASNFLRATSFLYMYNEAVKTMSLRIISLAFSIF